MNYPPATPHVILALQDPDLDVRKAAINSLGKMGDRVALQPLKTLLNDEQEVVRVLAKLAIDLGDRQSDEADGW